MTLTELEVEIAWTEKDLNNAEQNDNPQMVFNIEKRLKELYKVHAEYKQKMDNHKNHFALKGKYQ